MKTRYAVFLAFVLFAAGFGAMYTLLNLPERIASEGTPLIGGPFSLMDTNGRRVTDRDFRGKLMLVFFGYSHCPDVCPTELQTMSEVMNKLGPEAGKVAPIFISVDPKRDTPEVLAAYMKNFEPAHHGINRGPERDRKRCEGLPRLLSESWRERGRRLHGRSFRFRLSHG